MEYRGNSNNLFKKYSNALNEKEKQVDIEKTDSSKEIIEYSQRHRLSTKNLQNNSAKQCKVIVRIGGMQHMMSAPDQDGENYVIMVSERADRLISQIQNENPGMSLTNSIILSIVNAMDELCKSEQKIERYEILIEKRNQEIESIKNEYFKQREVNWELKKEVLRIKELSNQRNEYPNTTEETDEDMLPLEQMVFTFNESEIYSEAEESEESEDPDDSIEPDDSYQSDEQEDSDDNYS